MYSTYNLNAVQNLLVKLSTTFNKCMLRYVNYDKNDKKTANFFFCHFESLSKFKSYEVPCELLFHFTEKTIEPSRSFTWSDSIMVSILVSSIYIFKISITNIDLLSSHLLTFLTEKYSIHRA